MEPEKEQREQTRQAEKPAMDPFSQSVQRKKEELYSKVPLSLKHVNIILWLSVAALLAVIVLIALEAAGIYSVGGT